MAKMSAHIDVEVPDDVLAGFMKMLAEAGAAGAAQAAGGAAAALPTKLVIEMKDVGGTLIIRAEQGPGAGQQG